MCHLKKKIFTPWKKRHGTRPVRESNWLKAYWTPKGKQETFSAAAGDHGDRKKKKLEKKSFRLLAVKVVDALVPSWLYFHIVRDIISYLLLLLRMSPAWLQEN